MPPVQSAGVVVPQLATLACLLGLARLALAGAPYSGGAAVPLRAPAKAADSAAFSTPVDRVVKDWWSRLLQILGPKPAGALC